MNKLENRRWKLENGKRDVNDGKQREHSNTCKTRR